MSPDDENDSDGGELFDGVEDVEGEIQSDPILTPEDRPRGILSPTDREYLCGLKEYEHAQSEANRRQDIRKRVQNGLEDFVLLWLLLDRNEMELIFDSLDEETIHNSFSSMFAFAYRGLDSDKNWLEEIIESGVLLGANYDTSDRREGEATDVEVSIDIEYNPDVDAIYGRLKSEGADQLTPREIGVLVREGKIDAEELAELEDSSPDFPGVSAGDTIKNDE